jgi:hypothetical protein
MCREIAGRQTLFQHISQIGPVPRPQCQRLLRKLLNGTHKVWLFGLRKSCLDFGLADDPSRKSHRLILQNYHDMSNATHPLSVVGTSRVSNSKPKVEFAALIPQYHSAICRAIIGKRFALTWTLPEGEGALHGKRHCAAYYQDAGRVRRPGLHRRAPHPRARYRCPARNARHVA